METRLSGLACSPIKAHAGPPCWGWRDSAVAILEREVAVNDPLWPKCGADCCQWVVNNHWLYWQPALLPGGLWQHFSSIPTFLLPRALQCFHPEVNIDEVTLSTLSMLFHNKTCTRSAMESVIEIAGANRDYGRSVPWVD